MNTGCLKLLGRGCMSQRWVGVMWDPRAAHSEGHSLMWQLHGVTSIRKHLQRSRVASGCGAEDRKYTHIRPLSTAPLLACAA